MGSAPPSLRIPFFNYARAFAAREDQFVAILRDVIRRGAYIQQADLARFESNLAKYLDIGHAIGVANCTDGLLMALRAVGLRPGDEVIFPSHTMVATAAAAAHCGARLVPVECGADHLIDPAAVESAITPKTRVIMPVSLNGRTCKMDAILEIAERYGITVVEDAAQALGSRYKGRHAGTFGAAAAFSFYPAKLLGCLGDGGAVVTHDHQIARTVLLLRDHGRDENGEVRMWGLNSRLDNLQAAFLDVQLADYDKVIARRRHIAALYQQRLGGVAELTLPPAPDSDPDHFDVYQNYEIEADRRDDLRTYLRERGIGTLVQWGGKAVHQFADLGLPGPLPITERMFSRCLMLPMSPMLTDDEVHSVADAVCAFYGHGC